MNETERTTPEQMLDILADHIKIEAPEPPSLPIGGIPAGHYI